jgi:dephospho-CoA kinase
MIEEEPEPEPREKVKIIGITGGIGSGKSTVSELIENAGYPVYYSDIRAKTIVNDNAELKQKIKELLGEDSYDENGFYNRKYVAEIVFNNEELLLKLNSLIHPAVKIDFGNWVENQNTEFVFKETALLFELKLNESCYKSLLVTADDNCRLKRVMDRDQKTYREVETIMLRQMPEKDKIKIADFIIFNNDGLEELEEETQKILAEILSS